MLYIGTVFFTRWIDFKIHWYSNGLFYKDKLNKIIWFIPVVNIIYCIILFFEILLETTENTENKHLQKFFFTKHYTTNKEKNAINIFNKEFYDNDSKK